jgi:ABC-type branched-subunit amino acid transport system ATPase component
MQAAAPPEFHWSKKSSTAVSAITAAGAIVLIERNIEVTLDLASDVVIINTGAAVFQGTAAGT